MKVLNDNGESVTANTRTGTYILYETRSVDLQRENDILKKRCASFVNSYACSNCEFKCPYRKKMRFSND